MAVSNSAVAVLAVDLNLSSWIFLAERNNREYSLLYYALLFFLIHRDVLQEWPVCLMRWKDRSTSGSQLEVVDEFRSFVKPTWAPKLSSFCTNLTGITQVGCGSR